jgi:hypothetical protein
MVAATLFINTPHFVGPLSSLVHSADFSVFAGLGVGGAVYLLLSASSVRKEVADASAVLT